MSRTRISTTVDADLLAEARTIAGTSDSSMLEQALAALIAVHRRSEIDAAYAVYDEQPLDLPDAWGDLGSFRRAAGSS